MPGLKARDGESVEKLMKAFKKQVEKAGVLSDLKKRQHYEKPSVRLKKKSAAARKRKIKQARKMSGAI
jgi:small subunit ribosomal protein S21